MKRAILTCVLLLSLISVKAQYCLTLLDSASYYLTSNPIKSEQLTDELMVNLDGNACQKQIGYSKAYTNVGMLFWKLNQRTKSFDALEKALIQKLSEVDSTSIELMPYYENLFSVSKDFGNYKRAGVYLDKTTQLISSAISASDYFNHLIRSAIFFRETGQFKESRSNLDLAKDDLDQYLSKNDSAKAAWAIESGTLNTIMGNYSKADGEFEEAIQILRNSYPLLKTRAVDRMAKLKYEEGDFGASEVELLSNINFKGVHFPDDSLLLVESINNLGLLYFRINDLSNAEKYFNQLNEIAKSYEILKPYVTNNLGVIKLKRGELDEAEDFFKESMRLFQQSYGTLHPDYNNSLNNLAGVRLKKGQTQLALSAYMKVLDYDKVLFGKKHLRYATTLTNLSTVYKKLGYFEIASQFLEESVRIKKRALGGLHHLYAESLNDLGIAYLEKSDTLGAMHLFDSALSIDIRHMYDVFPVLTDRQRELFYNDIISNLGRFSAFCFDEQYVNSDWSSKALNYYINTKSALFYASDKLMSTSTASFSIEIRNKSIRWREKKFELAKAYLLSEKDRSSKNISIDSLEYQCHQLEKELAVNSRIFADQAEFEFYTWQDISESLSDSTALLEIIEYKDYRLINEEDLTQGFVDESRYIAFLVKNGGQIERIKWDRNVGFEKQFKFYKNSLIYHFVDNQSYNAFWKIVDNKLNDVATLYIAPDGIWNKMNSSIFYDQRTSKYMADKYDIVNVTSGKDLIVKNAQKWNRVATIVGNPNFSTLDIKNPPEQLPGAEREAKYINDILATSGWSSTKYMFADATEEVVKNVSNNSIIHIATHGFFFDNQENPLLNSGLYLSKSADGQDGILTAYEAMNLNLEGTQLVVLSACETGLGEVKNGEGVYGLQRSFLVAGTENLVFSLVKIKDQATREFMGLFYCELIIDYDVKRAFFAARRLFRQNYPEPYDWGAFVLATKG